MRNRLFLLVLYIISIITAGPALAIPTDFIQQSLKAADKDYFPDDLKPAVLSLQRNRPSEALALIKAVTSKWRRPQYAERVSVLKGLCHLQLEEREEAVAAFNQAITLSPSSSDAHFLTAIVLTPKLEESDPEEVKKTELIKRSPDELLLEKELREKELAKVESHLMDSVWFSRFGIVPSPTAFAEYAKILKLNGKNDKALKAALKAQELGADDSDFRLLLSDLYVATGKRNQAIVILRKELAQDPTLSKFKLSLSKALLSGASRQMDKPLIREAAELAREASSDRCCRLIANQTLIRAYIELGELDLAEQTATGTIQRYPDDTELKTLQEQIAIERAAKLAE